MENILMKNFVGYFCKLNFPTLEVIEYKVRSFHELLLVSYPFIIICDMVEIILFHSCNLSKNEAAGAHNQEKLGT